ncbi:MAG: peptide chain release factor 1 [Ruminococcaceae bacterium]|nr:peptide chain release factor 1 [Oscillospiraceae bacterium]
MQDKLFAIEQKYRNLEESFADPSLLANPAEYARRMKEYRALEPTVLKYRELCEVLAAMADAEELLRTAGTDADIKALAAAELRECKEAEQSIRRELTVLLIPRDPNDDKNVLVEIRAGTGGEEAALFAADLFRMYSMYAASAGFRVSVTSANETELGGYREIVFMVEGDGAYSRFRFESGTHRVQRVPETESQGRIQTSAATVAVLPEAEDVHIEINPADLVFESCKSSGAGGQHVNKTESAVRLTHKPSGIVVECDQERSQFKNKDMALKMLKTKLYDIEQRQKEDEIAASRRSQVGSGDRSGRIRTYNFPQGRVTDHRIGLTLYSLDAFLNGNISEMIEALISADTAERLQRQNET